MPVLFSAFMTMTIIPPSFPFDQQAGRFDRESGLPAAAKPVAKALLEWDRHGTGLLLEIGIIKAIPDLNGLADTTFIK